MSEKRFLYFALGVLCVVSVGAVTNQIVNELDRQIGSMRGQLDTLTLELLLAEDNLITLDDLPENIVQSAPTSSGDADPNSQLLCDIERRHVQTVLRQEKGNKVHAAKALGISRRALYRLIEKYQLQD